MACEMRFCEVSGAAAPTAHPCLDNENLVTGCSCRACVAQRAADDEEWRSAEAERDERERAGLPR